MVILVVVGAPSPTVGTFVRVDGRCRGAMFRILVLVIEVCEVTQLIVLDWV